MKTLLKLILLSTFLFSSGLQCQNNIKKIKVYQVWITKTDHSKEKGYLYSTDMKGLKISHGTLIDTVNLSFINANEIQYIKLRKKRKALGHALIGGVAGASIGVLIGLSEANNSEGLQIIDDDTATVISGALLAIVGSGLGFIIAKAKRKIQIDGDVDIFYQHLKVLDECSMKQYKK